ncbi:MAG: hypothetical protein AAGG68_11400 [Bacteroidota bacterium]
MKQFLLLPFLLFLLSCAEDTTTVQEDTTSYTPEQVLRKYQAHVDKNEFEAAKKFSTQNERERLDAVAELIAAEPADSTVYTTIFLEVNCQESKDQAICDCLIEGFEERDTFVLMKAKGQWLVDAPEEEIDYDYNEEVEEFIQEELEKENG